MRVIAGIYRSRILKSLKGLALRPTSDRLSVTVLAVDALRGLAMLAARKNSGAPAFDHIFLDPPYAAAEDYSRVLEFLGSADLLAPGGIVIAEHRRNFDLLEEPGTLKRFRVLRRGDAALSFYRRRSETGG